MINKLLILCFLWICSWLLPTSNSIAQTPYIPHYTTKNGLASNNCYGILQDKKGFIWVATDAGVNRFDGTSFQTFSIDDGLPDTQILQVKEDKDGKIWFLALNGQLGYFNKGKIYNQNNQSFLKKLNFNTVIVSFYEDSKGRLWLGTNANLIVMWDGRSVKKYISSDRDHQLTNAFIHEDEKGRIWSYSNGGTHLFNEKAFVLDKRNLAKPLSYKTAYNLVDHSMLFLDNKGLKIKTNNLVRQLLTVDTMLLNNNSGYFFFDHHDKSLWLSNNYGIVAVDNKGKTKKIISDISATQIIEDSKQNLWISSNNGIYMLPNQNERLYIINKKNGLSNDIIKSVVKDAKNRLWLGLDNANINIVDTRSFEVKKIYLEDNKRYKNIKQLSIDSSKQAIYFASDYGLGVLKDIYNDKPDVSFLRESNNSFFVVKHFSLAKNNNQLALALSSGVVFLADRINNLEFNSLNYKEKEDFFKDRSYHVFYDRNGNLWFSNINGLSEFSNGRLYKHFQKNTLLTKRINDIKQLNDGTLVLATDGYGILLYKSGKLLKQISQNEGLTNNICHKIFIKNDQIWVVTNKGINKISFSNNNTTIINFEYGKELLANGVNNLYIDDTNAYFATNEGLVYTRYQNKQINSKGSKVYITSITCNKTTFPNDTTQIELDNGNHTLSFSYSSVNFTTNNILYRYRLKSTTNWTETKARRLEFSSLEPGNYTFEVCAKTQNSDWSVPTSVSFNIKEPIWQTFWFISVEILIAGFLFYQAIVYFTKKQRDKEQQQLLLKNKVLILEQQALQAMMNPHFIFNVMNAIQHYINTRDTSSANKILTGFAKLIRKNLDICTKSYISLEEELDYLNLYLNLEKSRFGDKLRYSIEVEKSIDKEETLIPSMLLQPYIENAIWHGIMPKEDGGDILIKINRGKENYLLIEITDNGIGIDNSIKNKKKEHSSKGMALTKERLNLLSQIEAKPIQLNIFQNGIQGTTVLISIPLL